MKGELFYVQEEFSP